MPTAKQFSEDFDTGEFDAPAPAPSKWVASWLAPASVKEWLRLPDDDTVDDDLIGQVCADVEDYVQTVRPEPWDAGHTTYTPTSRIYRGAVLLAAREYRRRNSPAGIEAFGDAGISFVSRYDPEIERLLEIGAYAPPTIA